MLQILGWKWLDSVHKCKNSLAVRLLSVPFTACKLNPIESGKENAVPNIFALKFMP